MLQATPIFDRLLVTMVKSIVYLSIYAHNFLLIFLVVGNMYCYINNYVFIVTSLIYHSLSKKSYTPSVHKRVFLSSELILNLTKYIKSMLTVLNKYY